MLISDTHISNGKDREKYHSDERPKQEGTQPCQAVCSGYGGGLARSRGHGRRCPAPQGGAAAGPISCLVSCARSRLVPRFPWEGEINMLDK